MFVAFLVFIVAPIIELYVMVQVASVIGVLPTVLLIVLSAVAGAWLVKVEGLGVLRRMQRTLEAGQLPTDEAVNGLLVVLGGGLMFLPGFVSSAIGLLLLLPPVRALLRPFVLRGARRRIDRGQAGVVTFAGPILDVDSHLDPRSRPERSSRPPDELGY
jgi:UPF0716 protein FxsA